MVDEAYVDFGNESVVPLVNRYDNLLVVQTLSKSRSLAGMRIGLAMGHPQLIEALNRIKNSFNSYTMDRLAQAAAVRAYEDEGYYREINNKIIRERERFKKILGEMGIPCTDSKSNFVFITLPDVRTGCLKSFQRTGYPGKKFCEDSRIADWLRITIGTKDDMDRVVEAIKRSWNGEGFQ